MHQLRWIVSALFLGLSAAWSASGTADLRGTTELSPIKGTVQFVETGEGLEVKVQLVGVPPGAHGFHIHEFGDCSEQGKAAGGHFNPMGAPHGHALKAGPGKSHPGDMGNLTVGSNGEASLSLTLPGVSLSAGPLAVAGRAVVLHEKADDFSQPVGNAGGRIGCGAILVTGN
jgi:Cu-Zn family superoxide dismutase